jgi:hypothetical protein
MTVSIPLATVLKRHVTASSADPLAGHGSLENRDGRRTIRRRLYPVKRFFKKNIFAFFPGFSAILPHAETSSTSDFHRWKIHPRIVEKAGCSATPARVVRVFSVERKTKGENGTNLLSRLSTAG